MDHHGKHIDWGKWAITCNDPDFHGEGNPDTGEDYGAAPGESAGWLPEACISRVGWVCCQL